MPPAALNLEYNQNVKLDYVKFVSENSTGIIYETLDETISNSAQRNIRNFLVLARHQVSQCLHFHKIQMNGVLQPGKE